MSMIRCRRSGSGLPWGVLALVGATMLVVPPSGAHASGGPAAEKGASFKTAPSPADGGDPVDPRLQRPVRLSVKAVSLEELCRRLSASTGARLAPGRGVADENVTVLVEDVPARAVMREVARLFGYSWSRSGSAGAYSYTLVQDLRGELAEEEMRNRDLHAAYVALDDELSRYAPYLHLSPTQLRERAKTSPRNEKQLLTRLAENWGAVQLYHRLTAAQRLALTNGERLEFEPNAVDPDRRIPAELRPLVLQSIPLVLMNRDGHPTLAPVDPREGVPLAQVSNAQPIITLAIQRKEAGEVWLMEGHGAAVDGQNEPVRAVYNGIRPIAIGRSPAVAQPDNARENAPLKRLPEFRRRIDLEPESSCPAFAPGAPASRSSRPYSVSPDGTFAFGQEPPHVFSGDVWEAVHRATGMPVVADAYSRVILRDRVVSKDVSTFAALVRAGDAMRVRWRKDGEFLLARSSSFFWDKLKEVPRRLLVRWRDHSRAGRGLPLSDLLDMARLHDEQLDSAAVGKVVEHCWGLEDWGIVGNSEFRPGIRYTELLPYARFLASLSPDQLRAAASPGGLAFASLPVTQQELLARPVLRFVPSPAFLSGMVLTFDYAPAGSYVWHPDPHGEDAQQATRSGRMVSGTEPTAVLAAARKLDPSARPAQIRKSPGALRIRCVSPNGPPFTIGGPF